MAGRQTESNLAGGQTDIQASIQTGKLAGKQADKRAGIQTGKLVGTQT